MIRAACRLAAAGAAGVLALAVLPASALAHITVDPREAPAGSFAELTFRVPNERPDAGTVRVEIVFPEDHPIANARVEPQPDWTHTVVRGEAPDAPVSRIVWEGGPIDPDEVEEFEVSVGPLPEDAERLVFPAVQTYSSGEVVRWIDVPEEGGAEPEHPAPVLRLTAAERPATSTTAPTAAPDTTAAPGTTPPGAEGGDVVAHEPVDDDGGAPVALIIAGVVLGGLGLAAGAAALVRSRRP